MSKRAGGRARGGFGVAANLSGGRGPDRISRTLSASRLASGQAAARVHFDGADEIRIARNANAGHSLPAQLSAPIDQTRVCSKQTAANSSGGRARHQRAARTLAQLALNLWRLRLAQKIDDKLCPLAAVVQNLSPPFAASSAFCQSLTSDFVQRARNSSIFSRPKRGRKKQLAERREGARWRRR